MLADDPSKVTDAAATQNGSTPAPLPLAQILKQVRIEITNMAILMGGLRRP
jgi:hypothetical protein